MKIETHWNFSSWQGILGLLVECLWKKQCLCTSHFWFKFSPTFQESRSRNAHHFPTSLSNFLEYFVHDQLSLWPSYLGIFFPAYCWDLPYPPWIYPCPTTHPQVSSEVECEANTHYQTLVKLLLDKEPGWEWGKDSRDEENSPRLTQRSNYNRVLLFSFKANPFLELQLFNIF